MLLCTRYSGPTTGIHSNVYWPARVLAVDVLQACTARPGDVSPPSTLQGISGSAVPSRVQGSIASSTMSWAISGVIRSAAAGEPFTSSNQTSPSSSAMKSHLSTWKLSTLRHAPSRLRRRTTARRVPHFRHNSLERIDQRFRPTCVPSTHEYPRRKARFPSSLAP